MPYGVSAKIITKTLKTIEKKKFNDYRKSKAYTLNYILIRHMQYSVSTAVNLRVLVQYRYTWLRIYLAGD